MISLRNLFVLLIICCYATAQTPVPVRLTSYIASDGYHDAAPGASKNWTIPTCNFLEEDNYILEFNLRQDPWNRQKQHCVKGTISNSTHVIATNDDGEYRFMRFSYAGIEALTLTATTCLANVNVYAFLVTSGDENTISNYVEEAKAAEAVKLSEARFIALRQNNWPKHNAENVVQVFDDFEIDVEYNTETYAFINGCIDPNAVSYRADILVLPSSKISPGFTKIVFIDFYICFGKPVCYAFEADDRDVEGRAFSQLIEDKLRPDEFPLGLNLSKEGQGKARVTVRAQITPSYS